MRAKPYIISRPAWESYKWKPLNVRPLGFGVKIETEVLSPSGLVIGGNRGHNMLTDGFMEGLTVKSSYLIFRDDTTEIACLDQEVVTRRDPQADNNLTVTYTDAANITLTASDGFFEEADVDRTLKIDGWPELLITGYTSTQEVAATARGGVWLPSFTPPASPAGPYANNWAVHYTNVGFTNPPVITLNEDNYDHDDPDYCKKVVVDPNTGPFEYKRAFVSDIIGGGATIRTICWGTLSPHTNTPYGVFHLANPDVIPPNGKYRVKFTLTIDIPAINQQNVALDLGPYLGTVNADVYSQHINSNGCFYVPKYSGTNKTINSYYSASQLSVPSVVYDFGNFPEPSEPLLGAFVYDASYTTGSHNQTFAGALLASDAADKSGVVVQGIVTREAQSDYISPVVINLDAQITMVEGVWAKALFQMFWTRNLS